MFTEARGGREGFEYGFLLRPYRRNDAFFDVCG